MIRYILTLALGSNANGLIINENYEVYEVNEDGCRGILIHESRVNPPSQKIHSQFHTVMLNLAAQAYFRLHLENVILNGKSLVAYWVGDMDESECRNLVELSEVAPVWKELKQPLDSRSSPTPQVSSNIHATFSNPNRAARANSPRATPHKPSALEAEINEALMCPITQEIMTDPVICSDGYTYQRSAIEEWLKQHHTSPMTGLQLMLPVTLIPNRAIGDVIERMKGNHTAKFPQM